MALGRVVRRFLALLALGWVLLLVALLASIDEPPVPEPPQEISQTSVALRHAAVEADRQPPPRAAQVHDGQRRHRAQGLCRRRRLKVVMAEVAKADVHTFTVRRL